MPSGSRGLRQFTSSERSSEACLEEGRCQRRRRVAVLSDMRPFPQSHPTGTGYSGFEPAAAAQEAAGRAAPTAELAGGGAVLALSDVGLELALLCTGTARVLRREEGGPASKGPLGVCPALPSSPPSRCPHFSSSTNQAPTSGALHLLCPPLFAPHGLLHKEAFSYLECVYTPLLGHLVPSAAAPVLKSHA